MTESHFSSNLETNQANLLPKWLVSRRRSIGLKSAEWFVILTGGKLKQRCERRRLAVTKQQITTTSDLCNTTHTHENTLISVASASYRKFEVWVKRKRGIGRNEKYPRGQNDTCNSPPNTLLLLHRIQVLRQWNAVQHLIGRVKEAVKCNVLMLKYVYCLCYQNEQYVYYGAPKVPKSVIFLSCAHKFLGTSYLSRLITIQCLRARTVRISLYDVPRWK